MRWPRRWVHVIAVFSIAILACTDEGPVFLNTEGSFDAISYDGDTLGWTRPVLMLDGSGNVVDTAALFLYSDLRMDLHDNNPLPDGWDDAGLSITLSCLQAIQDFPCDSSGTTWLEEHRYQATIDSLFIRRVGGGPEPWARAAWVGDQGGFDVSYTAQSTDNAVLIRFRR